MKALRLHAVVLLCLTVSMDGASIAQAQEHDMQMQHHSSDTSAPGPIMEAHLPVKGHLMLSYRYTAMRMAGNRIGSRSVSTDQVLQDFLISPTRMTMQMHMVGAMYSVSDRVTVSGMIPFLDSEMEHLTRMGNGFATSSGGIGDIRLAGVFGLLHPNPFHLHTSFGISLPTGTVTAQDVTPTSTPSETLLPYPMQIGSGTVDLLPGLTFRFPAGGGSVGIHTEGVIRLSKNNNGYRLGNEVTATAWGAHPLAGGLGASVQLLYTEWGNISGAAPLLLPQARQRIAPTTDSRLRGGRRLDFPIELNYEWGTGWLSGQRLDLGVRVPLFQDLDGPQLETDWTLSIGWQSTLPWI